jgi:hypothetical protein
MLVIAVDDFVVEKASISSNQLQHGSIELARFQQLGSAVFSASSVIRSYQVRNQWVGLGEIYLNQALANEQNRPTQFHQELASDCPLLDHLRMAAGRLRGMLRARHGSEASPQA